MVLPWLRYPAVLASGVACDLVAVGASLTGVRIGDRVVGYAVGVEKSRNSPAQGAFQTHIVLMAAPAETAQRRRRGLADNNLVVSITLNADAVGSLTSTRAGR